jgi:hypothetical protein
VQQKKKKEKDQREWTNEEEKTYLESRLSEYQDMRPGHERRGWLSREVALYFARFPTSAVTEREKIDHPDWTIVEKKQYQERVSNSRLNKNKSTHIWPAESQDLV